MTTDVITVTIIVLHLLHTIHVSGWREDIYIQHATLSCYRFAGVMCYDQILRQTARQILVYWSQFNCYDWFDISQLGYCNQGSNHNSSIVIAGALDISNTRLKMPIWVFTPPPPQKIALVNDPISIHHNSKCNVKCSLALHKLHCTAQLVQCKLVCMGPLMIGESGIFNTRQASLGCSWLRYHS